MPRPHRPASLKLSMPHPQHPPLPRAGIFALTARQMLPGSLVVLSWSALRNRARARSV